MLPRLFFLLLITFFTYHPSLSQSKAKQNYVIVHGAWGGSWAFKAVDSLLRTKGYQVYRPSLTGLGERSHLSASNIGLQIHINDVVNMILFEDLYDVTLVGHSYGGMVITGVADSLPNRIGKLIYLDAFVPDDGESVISLLGARAEIFKKMNVNGFLVPTWVPANQVAPKDVPHPFKTFTDNIRLKNKARLSIPSTYILTVDKGKNAKDDDFASQANKASQKKWQVYHLTADHNPQWSAPESLVALMHSMQKD